MFSTVLALCFLLTKNKFLFFGYVKTSNPHYTKVQKLYLRNECFFLSCHRLGLWFWHKNIYLLHAREVLESSKCEKMNFWTPKMLKLKFFFIILSPEIKIFKKIMKHDQCSLTQTPQVAEISNSNNLETHRDFFKTSSFFKHSHMYLYH